jgi:hypothetical protein
MTQIQLALAKDKLQLARKLLLDAQILMTKDAPPFYGHHDAPQALGVPLAAAWARADAAETAVNNSLDHLDIFEKETAK